MKTKEKTTENLIVKNNNVQIVKEDCLLSSSYHRRPVTFLF